MTEETKIASRMFAALFVLSAFLCGAALFTWAIRPAPPMVGTALDLGCQPAPL